MKKQGWECGSQMFRRLLDLLAGVFFFFNHLVLKRADGQDENTRRTGRNAENNDKNFDAIIDSSY